MNKQFAAWSEFEDLDKKTTGNFISWKNGIDGKVHFHIKTATPRLAMEKDKAMAMAQSILDVCSKF